MSGRRALEVVYDILIFCRFVYRNNKSDDRFGGKFGRSSMMTVRLRLVRRVEESDKEQISRAARMLK